MKRSDKLLLLLALAVLTLFGSAHLNLYWKYKHGMAASTHILAFVGQSFPAPVYLSIQGFQAVTLIPSDSFAIETRNDEHPPAHYLHGDTLVLSGFDTTVSAAKPEDVPGRTSYLRVYYNDIRLIRQESGFLSLVGDTLSQHPPLRLQVKNVTMSTGTPEAGGTPRFSQLSIDALHSNITLFSTASIHQLKLQLDSLSSGDIQSSIDQLLLDCDDNTHVAFTGNVIKKLQTAPPVSAPSH